MGNLLKLLMLISSIFIIFSCNGAFSSDSDVRGVRFKNGGGYIGCSPSMSPDGSKIVFGSTKYGVGDICIIKSDGSGWTRLTKTEAYEGEPKYSPDGRKIVFVSERDGNGEIYMMNSNGSDQTRLTTYPYYDAKPSFSPDGSKILFVRNVRNLEFGIKNSQIFIMNCDGSDVREIVHEKYWTSDPSFSPDGNEIAYKTGWYGENDAIEIRLTSVNGAQKSTLTRKGMCHEPAFSPDGKRILFLSNWKSEDFWSLYVIALKADVTTYIPVPRNVHLSYPTYIENGTKILFLNELDERGGNICVMNYDGTDIHVISKTY